MILKFFFFFFFCYRERVTWQRKRKKKETNKVGKETDTKIENEKEHIDPKNTPRNYKHSTWAIGAYGTKDRHHGDGY